MKRKNNEFVIAFQGLALGTHLFKWQLNSAFFERLNIYDAPAGNFEVRLSLEKKSNLMDLKFDISGIINQLCDRCLQPVSVPIQSANTLIVKFGIETKEMTDEILILDENSHELKVDHYIYEFICLAIPRKIVHQNDQCDTEMTNLILDEQPENTSESLDPRWDKLKNIKK